MHDALKTPNLQICDYRICRSAIKTPYLNKKNCPHSSRCTIFFLVSNLHFSSDLISSADIWVWDSLLGLAGGNRETQNSDLENTFLISSLTCPLSRDKFSCTPACLLTEWQKLYLDRWKQEIINVISKTNGACIQTWTWFTPVTCAQIIIKKTPKRWKKYQKYCQWVWLNVLSSRYQRK